MDDEWVEQKGFLCSSPLVDVLQCGFKRESQICFNLQGQGSFIEELI